MTNAINFRHHGELVTAMVQLVGAQGSFAATTTGADVDDLPEGKYAVWCDEGDVYIKVHATDASNVTVASAGGNGGYKIASGNVEEVRVPHQYHLGAVMVTGTGTLRYHLI